MLSLLFSKLVVVVEFSVFCMVEFGVFCMHTISVSSRLVSQLPSKVCMYFVHCTLWQAGKCLITKSNQSNFGTKPIAYPLRRALIIWHKASIPYPLRRVLATLQILFSGTRPLFSGSSCTIPSTERFGYLTQSLYTIPSPEGFGYFTIHIHIIII